MVRTHNYTFTKLTKRPLRSSLFLLNLWNESCLRESHIQNMNVECLWAQWHKKQVTVRKDTEAPVRDAQMPHIDAEVISRQVGLPITVDRDGVNMVGMSIGENSSGANLYHQICRFEYWHLQHWEGRKNNAKRSKKLKIQGRVWGYKRWDYMKAKNWFAKYKTPYTYKTTLTKLKLCPVQAIICKHTCREVMVEMSLIRPSSSFRLYPSGLLSLSLTFHSLMVLSLATKKDLHNQKKPI